jgi:predicted nicotinamide N-methyase
MHGFHLRGIATLLVAPLFLVRVSPLCPSKSRLKVSDVPVHRVPLHLNDDSSPFAYAASSIVDIKPHQNFLATQVWPAARETARFLQYTQPVAPVICELGCGPGLPSLTAAKLLGSVEKVIATDLDPLALELVHAAACDQGISLLETHVIDLCGQELPTADLYILSDVFESPLVAESAAQLLFSRVADKARVWVFCQSDRAQREAFQKTLSSLLGETLEWISTKDYKPTNRICLFNVDETEAWYGC